MSNLNDFIISNGVLEKYTGNGGDVVIPDNVTVIGDNVFNRCKLSSVVIPDTVTEIRSRAFTFCNGLQNIILPKNLTVIGNEAFTGCEFKTIMLPEGLKSIGEYTFDGVKLKEVVIPKSVETVGKGCFGWCKKIYVHDSIEPNAGLCTDKKSNAVLGQISIGNPYCYMYLAKCTVVVLSAETGDIKYEIPQYTFGDPMGGPKSLWKVITESWGKNATFDFKAVDNVYKDIKVPECKLIYALNRIKYPIDLEDVYRETYITYLKKNRKKVVMKCIDDDDLLALKRCEYIGVLDKKNINEMIEYAISVNKTDFIEYLQNYKSLLTGK